MTDPAAYLRETAALIRERVKSAQEYARSAGVVDRWHAQWHERWDDVDVGANGRPIAGLHGDLQPCGEWMASMDPAVGEALADWLEAAASVADDHIPQRDTACLDCAALNAALHFARTYRRDT